MIIARTKQEIRSATAAVRGKDIAFVPTMGALHAGHYSLVREARKAVGEEGIVIVSIFVNPTQFNNTDDLENYPNTLAQDLRGCENEGADIVFTPQANMMYEDDASITVSEGMLSTTLCGATRPGHFDGVCTVVLKLYNLVQPDVMVFGEKDFQQVAIIKRMVRDLDIPVQIISVNTVRDENGLALSSRNTRLSARAREEAPIIYKQLQKAADLLSKQELSPKEANGFIKAEFSALKSETKIDYVEVVDAETMQPVLEITEREVILAIAVFFDDIRLIDHLSVPSHP